jgi:hypothetical protein
VPVTDFFQFCFFLTINLYFFFCVQWDDDFIFDPAPAAAKKKNSTTTSVITASTSSSTLNKQSRKSNTVRVFSWNLFFKIHVYFSFGALKMLVF